MSDSSTKRPLSFQLARWHGFVFSSIFLIYGGVKIVLSILDRNYTDIAQPIIFAILGAILIAFAFAYSERLSWGWYGLVVLNALVIIASLFDYTRITDIALLAINAVIMIFSIAVIVALFKPDTKRLIFGPR